ncbi:MAG: hypothetical protein WBG36_11940 [Ornithinimicrobium sp.]
MAQENGAAEKSEATHSGPVPGDSSSGVRMFGAALVALVCAVGALWVSGAGQSNWIAGVLIVVGLLAILDLGTGVRARASDN